MKLRSWPSRIAAAAAVLTTALTLSAAPALAATSTPSTSYAVVVRTPQ